jgi:hypothetical protein
MTSRRGDDAAADDYYHALIGVAGRVCQAAGAQ